MLKKIICFQAFALLAATQALAQLYVGPGASMYVAANTPITTDSLVLIPSVAMTLGSTEFTHSNTPVPGLSGGASILQAYTLATPLNFQGTIGLYYTDDELNGNAEPNLQLAYNNGTTGNWVTTTGTTVNTSTHYLSRVFSTPIQFAGITATSTGVALPISILDFTARAEEQRVRLDWEMTVTDPVVCEVERSADGHRFSALEKVALNTANRTYRIYDNQPLQGTGFYRLRWNEGNGIAKYSPVRSVVMGSPAQQGLTLYPVPVHNRLYLNLSGTAAEGSYVTLASMDGKTLIRKDFSGETMSLDLQVYPTGIYLLTHYNGASIRHYKIDKSK